jgi:hypothetical protein
VHVVSKESGQFFPELLNSECDVEEKIFIMSSKIFLPEDKGCWA